jgi:trk system potassium uptake protein TrkA
MHLKDLGVKKVVAINNDMEYYNLMHSLGLVVVRGPKISAYNKIMEEISSTGVVLQKWFCGSKAIVFMRKIFKNSHLINKTIKPLKEKETKVYFLRDEELFAFDTKLTLKENDVIVTFTTSKRSPKIKQWIYGL